MSLKIAVIAGDGIGPEVTAEAVRVLSAVRPDIEFEHVLFGGAAYDDCGDPFPQATQDLIAASDSALLGAIGGPKWEGVETSKTPEAGLLGMRGALNLYANLRPAKTYAALADASPVKAGGDCDMLIVRELTGGIYFGRPRERRENGTVAIDTMVYSVMEVERIARRAFEAARTRRSSVVSVDKANVLETSRLWREVVNSVAPDYPDVSLRHQLVDSCAMLLIKDPGQFDVILTGNLFGDILSDEASMITGSLGMLPSASLGDPKNGKAFGVFEPIHGSAPDIAGQNVANPLAAILSGAMMLSALGDAEGAGRIEAAVDAVLDSGARTGDLGGSMGTSEMGRLVSRCTLG